MALTLAQEMDGNPRVKAPNHMIVLKMYCLEDLSVRVEEVLAAWSAVARSTKADAVPGKACPDGGDIERKFLALASGKASPKASKQGVPCRNPDLGS